MCQQATTCFKAENFRTSREWIYFCVEFDLDLCHGCHTRARKRPGERPSPWYCDSCEPQFHPDLLHALESRENVKTRCDLCHKRVPIKSCWISEDCRRLYCASHLKPLRKADRFRLARRYLKVRYRAGGDRTRLETSLGRLASHAHGVDCESCAFNTRGIYDGNRLVEVDRGTRRCDSTPDTLNCGGIEA